MSRKKVFPHTKHVTSPSSLWHTLHPAVFFTLTFSPTPKAPFIPALHPCRQAGSIIASRWAQDLSVPLARRAPVCGSCQQLLWPQQSASWPWERGSFFELLNCRSSPGFVLPQIFKCICCPEWMVTHIHTYPIHLNSYLILCLFKDAKKTRL